MNKKGITLIEIVVSMGLFAVLSTIIIGAYLMVLNMRALTSTMKETQQKMRIAIELVSRLGRQASSVTIKDSGGNVTPNGIGTTLELYFIPISGPATATRFKIEPVDEINTLTVTECTTMVSGNCTAWSTLSNDLLSGPTGRSISLDSETSLFTLDISDPPSLSMLLNGSITTVNNPYYSNTFLIDNKIILEGI